MRRGPTASCTLGELFLARRRSQKRAQHFADARPRTLAADALHIHARTFQEKENLVGDPFGIKETRGAAERRELFALMRLVLFNHSARGMILIRQLDRGVR